MFGSDLVTGMLSSATYDALKKSAEFIEPGYTGLIVETIDELTVFADRLNIEIIREFFLHDDVANQVKLYRKTAKINYDVLEQNFETICSKNGINNSKIILRDFFKILEHKLYKKSELRNKIELTYLQKISDSVDEMKKNVNRIPDLENKIEQVIEMLNAKPYPRVIMIDQEFKTKPENEKLTKELSDEDKDSLISDERITSSIEHIMQLSIHFFNEKDYDIANKLLTYILKQQPDNLDAKQNKATILATQNKNNECLKLVEEILNKDPHHVEALITKGVILRRKRRYAEAISCHEKALEYDPSQPLAYNGIGVCLAYQKKYDDAIKQYDLAIGLDQTNPQLWSNKGLSLYYNHEYEKAEKCYQKSFEIDSSHLSSLNNKALLEESKGNRGQALFFYNNAISIDSNCAPAWNNKGSLLLDENMDDAINHFQRAIDIDPEYVEAFVNLIYAYKIKNNYEKCLEYTNKVLSIIPDDIEILKQKIYFLVLLKKFDMVLKTCERVLNLDKNDVTALGYQAVALLETTTKYYDVIKIADKLLENNQQNSKALMFKGMAFRRLGKVKKALSILENAEQINQDDDAVITTKGTVLFDLGRFDEAKKCHEKAIKLNPKNPIPYYNLSGILILEDKVDELINNLKKAIELDPTIKGRIAQSDQFISLRTNDAFLNLFR